MVRESFFTDIIQRVQPTKTQLDTARRTNNNLRSQLESGNMGKRIVTSYQSGSYSRDTAVYPLDDVDLIFVIDPTKWELGLFEWGRPAPKKVLTSFRNAIAYRYPQSGAYVQNRSVRLELSSLNIDAVPAIDAGDDYILVPDRKRGDWIRSSPRRHTAISTQVNKRHGGRFKPLVKLIKRWNVGLPTTTRLKSFTIETMATTLFLNSPTLDSYWQGLHAFFDFVAHLGGEPSVGGWSSTHGITFRRWSQPLVPDLAGTGSNVAASVTEERRAKFVKKALISRKLLEGATVARTAETEKKRLSKALNLA